MTKQDEILLYEEAIKTYGIMPQVLMIVEECGELLSALSKYNRCRIEAPEVMTELADVSIMVEQMAVHFGYDDFIKERERKLNRLQNRLQNG
ncbi:MAG: hypothetical protein J1E16_04300 [Muribaculaceae bacterium]|nr:hypothetical protein [Muribaculaceae bacterium]